MNPFFPHRIVCGIMSTGFVGVRRRSKLVGGWMTETAKKGFSTWSLLVIVSLLAVWLAISRREAPEPRAENVDWLLYYSYQAGFWCLIFGLFWIVAGKRCFETATDSEGKVRYHLSIWAIVVFIGMFAVWLATPRHSPYAKLIMPQMKFFLCHQLALWTLIGTFVWLVAYRRRFTLLIGISLLTVVWLPMLSAVLEHAFTRKTTLTHSVLSSAGLGDLYYSGYQKLYTAFGYGPR
jgi:hypothetical protein